MKTIKILIERLESMSRISLSLLGGVYLVGPGLAEESKEYPLQLIPCEIKKGEELPPIYPSGTAMGTKLKLAPAKIEGLKGVDHMITTINIREGGQTMALARSKSGAQYDSLYIDTNLDGSLKDEKPIVGRVRKRRGMWWSNFDGRLLTRHIQKDALPDLGNYPVEFWIAVEQEDKAPEIIRYSGRGFFIGSTEIESVKHHVYVSDMTNDGLITEKDLWGVSAEGIREKRSSRRISDFVWVNGKAWKIKLGNDRGTQATLIEHKSDVSQKEDEDSRNPYKADQDAARAAKPLQFETDYQLASEKARIEKKPLFIKFETTWCVPCHMMTRYVFSAKDVVEAAKDIVCLKVDGDVQKDLVTKYKIKGYPNLLLLDSNGKELKRVVGYQSGKKMIKFFKAAEK